MALNETDKTADIFFVDTGEKEWLPQSDLRALSNVFLRLPFQAIECGLCSIKPVGRCPQPFLSQLILEV